MDEKRAWEAEDGTVFVEREDGGREIITGPPDDRKLYETQREDESDSEDLESDE